MVCRQLGLGRAVDYAKGLSAHRVHAGSPVWAGVRCRGGEKEIQVFSFLFSEMKPIFNMFSIYS